MGLKVYIDNEEIPLKKGDRETIGPIIQEINKILEKRNKIANNILINGKFLRENIIYNLDETIIEVATVSENEFLLDGIKSIEIYGEKYFDLLEELSECEYGDPKGHQIEKEMLVIGEWFLNLLGILKEDLGIDQEFPQINEYIDTLKREYAGIKEVIKQGDEECLYDILENDIAEVIYEISENLEKILKIYNELKIKMRLLN